MLRRLGPVGSLFYTQIYFLFGSDYGYACPAAIQMKRSVCQSNCMDCIVQGYSFITRKGPVTNVKIFRGWVSPINGTLSKADLRK